MKRLLKLTTIVSFLVFGSGACSKYLDIVPDNVATIESAFTLRATAERFLFTCYSWMPPAMHRQNDPAFGYWGAELWTLYPYSDFQGFLYSRNGEQGISDPRLNYWIGKNGGTSLFMALRDCNIFLDNIDNVQNISDVDRSRWIAEVKFLKAYYHFYLLRLYGPIPLIKENLPISASVEEVKVYRQPVDDCFSYITELLNEAIPDLPLLITDMESELGRITAPAAAAIKAKILTTAASPFFNGNSDYADFKDNRGVVLFNQTYDPTKWMTAADACKEAIDLCHDAGLRLYKFVPGLGETISDTTRIQMSIRNSVCDRWNIETIWADPNQLPAQNTLTPMTWDPTRPLSSAVTGRYGPSLEFTDIFYTENGVPIEEDHTWDYAGRYDLKVAQAADRYNIRLGYTTVSAHYDRENRFYASVGFDGGIWYGQGKYNDNDTWFIAGKAGQAASVQVVTNHTPTGYWPKKLIHYQNVIGASTYSVVWYPTPMMRLADLYLLYAEALNESSNVPSSEVYQYLNAVRERAGLPTVQHAWTNYSTNPTKFMDRDGLREIIHQERQIELAYEAHRYWDLRRWKRAHIELSKPISRWDLYEATSEGYYQKVVVYEPKFEQRNYLDPIAEVITLTNKNIVPNPGW